MAKKLEKSIEGTVVKLKVISTDTTLECDFATLPQDIQDKLGPFGLGHKLGDAAAGKDDAEIETAIMKVFEGLEKGDWSVRAPAGPKVSKKAISDGIAGLDEAEASAAIALLKKLGITL